MIERAWHAVSPDGAFNAIVTLRISTPRPEPRGEWSVGATLEGIEPERRISGVDGWQAVDLGMHFLAGRIADLSARGWVFSWPGEGGRVGAGDLRFDPSQLPQPLPREFPGGRLRRLRASDLAAFQAYRAIPELGRFQGWTPMADADAAAFIARMADAPLFWPGEWAQLGIADSASDALVGDIGLHLSGDGSTGEIGFTLAPSAQGRGMASQAVQEALRLFLAETSASQVLGITDERNGPSIRLLERLGFQHAESRQAEYRGEPCVERVYTFARPGRMPA